MKDLKYLNNNFGKQGRTFKTRKEAKNYEMELKGGGYITRLVNYNTKDIEICRGVVKAVDGVVPFAIGWLVTNKEKITKRRCVYD